MTRYLYKIQADTRHRTKHRAERYRRRDTLYVRAVSRKEARVRALEILDGMDLDLQGRLHIKRKKN